MSSVTHDATSGQEGRKRPGQSPEFMRTIARKGGLANAAKNGREHMARIGRKGGITTLVLYDRDDIGDRISAGHARRRAARKAAEGSAA